MIRPTWHEQYNGTRLNNCSKKKAYSSSNKLLICAVTVNTNESWAPDLIYKFAWYRLNAKSNKNLAIADTACHLRTQYIEDIYRPKDYTVTLKSMLRVTKGHCKQNHWIDHTRLSSNQSYLTLNIIVTLKCGLKVIESGIIWNLGYGFLFALHSNYRHIFHSLWDIQHQSIVWPWKLG